MTKVDIDKLKTARLKLDAKIPTMLKNKPSGVIKFPEKAEAQTFAKQLATQIFK